MTAFARIERFLWAALLLSVPVSASPLLPMGEGTLVRPLAMIPAALLLAMAAFRIVQLRQWPSVDFGRSGVLLAGFVAYVVIAGLASVAFLPQELFKGQTPLDSFVRALVTLGVGLGFFVVARMHIRAEGDVRRAIRLLFIGMSASIALAAIQVLAIVMQGSALRAVQAITDVFAVHYDGLVSRAQGMTFEPSWLATQVIVLLMPPLIAYSVSREDFAAARITRRGRMFVVLCFMIVIGGLLCAGSRFGIVCLVGLIMLSSLLAMRRGNIVVPLAFTGLLLAGAAGLAGMSQLGAGAGASYVLGPVHFLTNDADSASNSRGATDVSDIMAMAGRLSAAEAAYSIWLDHPAFGVSLGNGYRYFGKFAPDWAFTTQLFTQGAKEGVGWLDPNSPEKGNAKSLFLRLLAETGVIGFVLFTAFLFTQIFDGRPGGTFHAAFRLVTAAALFLAFINQDSFADPVFWIPLALCAALNRISREQGSRASTGVANARRNTNIPQSV